VGVDDARNDSTRSGELRMFDPSVSKLLDDEHGDLSARLAERIVGLGYLDLGDLTILNLSEAFSSACVIDASGWTEVAKVFTKVFGESLRVSDLSVLMVNNALVNIANALKNAGQPVNLKGCGIVLDRWLAYAELLAMDPGNRLLLYFDGFVPIWEIASEAASSGSGLPGGLIGSLSFRSGARRAQRNRNEHTRSGSSESLAYSFPELGRSFLFVSNTTLALVSADGHPSPAFVIERSSIDRVDYDPPYKWMKFDKYISPIRLYFSDASSADFAVPKSYHKAFMGACLAAGL